MKRINNKGFAITTLLYGIVLMVFLVVFALMSILGTTRKNTKNLTAKIEEELNMYASTNMTMIYDSSIEGYRHYIAPSSGWYRIELWGSKFTYSTAANLYNNGSYISGMIYLQENNYIYVYLGADKLGDTDSYVNLSEDEDTTIMLAPGATAPGVKSTHYKMFGYAGTQVSQDTGDIDTSKDFNIEYGEYVDGIAKKSSISPKFYDGLYVPNVNTNTSKFRISKISDNTKENPPGRGTNEKLNNVRYIKDCAKGNNDLSHQGKYPHDVHWVELQAIENGKNVVLNKKVEVFPEYILKGSTAVVITDGKAEDSSKYATFQDTEGTIEKKCITIDLEKNLNLDEVAIWHYYEDKRSYYNHTLSVSNDGNNWLDLRQTTYSTYYCGTSTPCTITTAESESSVGIRYNSFQPHSERDKNLPEGKYYIFYTGDENKNTVLTQNDNNIKVSLFTAEKNQQWQVSRNSDGSYKITNIETNFSLEKQDSSVICKNKAFNVNQKWNISGDIAGFSFIMDPTRSAPSYAIKQNMNLDTSTNADSSQRFKFVKIN